MSGDQSSSSAPSASRERRRAPVQARAHRTVEKILTAATEILIESGLPSLNTNAIAARAQVNVSTLYSYFPDKISIIRELFERFEDLRGEYVQGKSRAFEVAPDWHSTVDEVIHGLMDMRRTVPGGAALRAALQVVPELEELDHQSTLRTAGRLAHSLRVRNPKLGRERAEVVALTVSETVTRMLDLAQRAPGDEAIIDELSLMIRNYLAAYLGLADASESGPAQHG
ncbi:TetR/AcrR family transcriptional regulator [Streptomyces sp. NPDC002573]|uniref:TetR/AcrR family transcriptional regulator n=1 Tax=Streptomyces sp. NPDC002573 TaxID=3364651 RepID=UPI0036CF8474